MAGFKVVRDYLAEGQRRRGEKWNDWDVDRKGFQSKDYNEGEKHVRVKTYDDDGTLYYEMVCATEEDAERAHDWSQADSGTVRSTIKIGKEPWGEFIS